MMLTKQGLKLISLTAIVILGVCAAMAGEKPVLELLPAEIDGWKADGQAENYDRETIFNYMDGAGEIYLTYSFKSLLVRRYIKNRHPEILVEIFDMVSGEEAFGIFSHVQSGTEEAGIGQGSEYRRGLLCFWKDRFFVCVRAERETDTSRAAVLNLGKAISNSVKTTAEKPALLRYLPAGELSAKGILYFHTYEILNYRFFVADSNILNLNKSTGGVFAPYKDGSAYLLLLQYRNAKESDAALKRFSETYMPDAKGKGIIKTENGKWTATASKSNFVLVIFDAATEAEARHKLNVIISKLTE